MFIYLSRYICQYILENPFKVARSFIHFSPTGQMTLESHDVVKRLEPEIRTHDPPFATHVTPVKCLLSSLKLLTHL